MHVERVMKKKLLALIARNENVPPLPDVLTSLERKINDPDSDINDISALIETDPVLSGKLVKLSNSVFFSGGGENSKDMSEAVLRLGIKMILELIYTIELPNIFKKPRGFDALMFWRHSLAVAFLSKSIALHASSRLSREEIEVSYLAGLMHDLGILLFDFLIPEEYEELLKETASSREDLCSLEIKRFGISHSELGAEFIRRWWPVSAGVVDAVKHHDKPHDEMRGIARVVALANWLAHEAGFEQSADVPHEDAALMRLNESGISPDELKVIIKCAQEGVRDAEYLLKQ